MPDKPLPVSCLFVHGWGMNHSVWQPVREKLPAWIEACAIDLPGHGQRSSESFNSLQSLTADIRAQCEKAKKPGQALVLVGWSLGALACLKLLSEEFSQVDALLVVSSNPCFVSRDDWEGGISAEVFDQFGESLKADFPGTIRRFLSLQVKGSESGRATLRNLREKILQQPVPDAASLDAGLEILKQVDLRSSLPSIKQPVSWALGAKDGLVKAELSDELTRLMKSAEVKVYDNAGHAPFLSDADEFVQQLMTFIKRYT